MFGLFSKIFTVTTPRQRPQNNDFVIVIMSLLQALSLTAQAPML
jgi:hypothetical protein